MAIESVQTMVKWTQEKQNKLIFVASTGSIVKHYCPGNRKSLAFFYIQKYALLETWHSGMKFWPLMTEDPNAVTRYIGNVLSVGDILRFKKADKLKQVRDF